MVLLFLFLTPLFSSDLYDMKRVLYFIRFLKKLLAEYFLYGL